MVEVNRLYKLSWVQGRKGWQVLMETKKSRERRALVPVRLMTVALGVITK